MSEKELVKCESCFSNPKYKLSNIQKMVYDTVVEKGFYEKWNKAREILGYNNPLCLLIDLAEMALMHSEISEAEENIRDGNRELAIVELAGLVIRVLSYCENLGYDLQKYILSENERNKKREKYHGRKII